MNAQIDAFLRYLREDRNASANTVLAYKSDLLQFMEFLQTPPERQFDHLRLNDWSGLTPEHLESFVVDLDAYEYVRSTIARKVAALRIFVQWLREQETINFDAVAYLRPPSAPRNRPKVLSHQDVRRLFEATGTQGDRPESLRDRAMMEILYATGVRASELLALNLDDIDNEYLTISVSEVASSPARMLELPPQATRALREYVVQGRPQLAHASSDDVAVFLNHRGSRLTRQGLWLLFKGYANELGIDAFSPHILRHSFAVHSLEQGKSLADVQSALGHVSRSTTATYQRQNRGSSAE